MILFTFSVINFKLEFFSEKNINSKLFSRYKMNEFCALNRGKAIKKLVLVSEGKRCLLSEFELNLRAVLLELF